MDGPEGADVTGDGVFVQGDANSLEHHVHTSTIDLLWTKIDQEEVCICSASHNLQNKRILINDDTSFVKVRYDSKQDISVTPVI